MLIPTMTNHLKFFPSLIESQYGKIINIKVSVRGARRDKRILNKLQNSLTIFLSLSIKEGDKGVINSINRTPKIKNPIQYKNNFPNFMSFSNDLNILFF